MIVPGEASESEDEEISTQSLPPPSSQPEAAAKSKGGFLPEQLAYQFSRVTKQLGNLSRPSYQPETEEDKSDAKSLFHEKLFEKNRSLKTTIDRFVDDHIGKVPRDVNGLLSGCNRTQVYFQDSVLSMQQANHFSSLLSESMDDFLVVANTTKFPS